MPNLTADQNVLAIVQNGELPESVTCKGDGDAIYRGSILTWDITNDKWVASQAASSTTPLVYGGVVDAGTTAASAVLTMYKDFTLKGKTVSGSPEIGSTVYLKTRGTGGDISDNAYVTDGDTASLSGTSNIAAGLNPTVTGTSTYYMLELNVGDSMYVTADGVTEALVISSITNNTSLTLAGTYGGTTGSSLAATAVYESDLTTNPTETFGGTAFYNVAVGKIESGTLAAGWDIHFQRGLAAEGTSTFVDIAVSNNASIGNDLGVTGDATVGGDLGVTGDVNVTVDVNVTEDVNVTKDVNVTEDVNVTLDLDVDGVTTLDQTTITTDDGDFAVDGGGSVSIVPTEVAADAIVLNASGGGVDVIAGGATHDVDISSTNADVNVGAGADVDIDATANAEVTGGTGVAIEATTGDIDINSVAGEVDIDGVTAVNITVTGASADATLESVGGSVNITATEDDAQAIYIRSNGGTSDGIHISADQGEGDDAINIDAVAGGVDVDAAKSITITSSEEQPDAIVIDASGTAGGIDISAGTANIDIDNDGTIAIGGATCTSVDIGRTTIISRALGGIELDEASVCNSTLQNSSNGGYFNVVTYKYTIGWPSHATADQTTTANANKGEQNYEIGTNLIPALGRVLDVTVHCNENWTGSSGNETGLSTEIGNASSGNQYMAAANINNLNDIGSSATGGTFLVAASATATSVWIGLTPTVNNWDVLSAGETTVYITFVDNSSNAIG